MRLGQVAFFLVQAQKAAPTQAEVGPRQDSDFRLCNSPLSGHFGKVTLQDLNPDNFPREYQVRWGHLRFCVMNIDQIAHFCNFAGHFFIISP